MQKLQNEQNLRNEKYSSLIFFTLFLIVGLLSVARVFAANRLVETSDNLRKMDVQVNQLEAENRILAQEVRSKESMVFVETKMTELGFTKTPHYTYVNSTVRMAFLQ